VPVLAPQDVATLPPARLGHRLDRFGRLSEDALLDRLSVAVQLLELRREPASLVVVLGEHELERDIGPAESPGCVDAGCEPEGDGTCVHRRRIDT
jgi:hypothetical protein